MTGHKVQYNFLERLLYRKQGETSSTLKLYTIAKENQLSHWKAEQDLTEKILLSFSLFKSSEGGLYQHLARGRKNSGSSKKDVEKKPKKIVFSSQLCGADSDFIPQLKHSENSENYYRNISQYMSVMHLSGFSFMYSILLVNKGILINSLLMKPLLKMTSTVCLQAHL